MHPLIFIFSISIIKKTQKHKCTKSTVFNVSFNNTGIILRSSG